MAQPKLKMHLLFNKPIELKPKALKKAKDFKSLDLNIPEEKKLNEKDLEFTEKKGKEPDAHRFLVNLAMHSLSSTASYHDGETTTAPNGKDYEFAKKKSEFLDHKVLKLEKW